MLMLLLHVDEECYALPCDAVVEVLPAVPCKQLPHARNVMVGILSYHGAPVPVLDLNYLIHDKPAARRMSSRIVLVRYADATAESHLLGLLVEKLTNTLRTEAGEFKAAGVDVPAAPYLGPVIASEHGWIQRLELNNLLEPGLRSELFREEAS